MSKPIDVSEYRVTRMLPKELGKSFPLRSIFRKELNLMKTKIRVVYKTEKRRKKYDL